jgi:hypothetical protein
MILQSFAKDSQALVEGCCIVPERCVPGVRHQVDLSVSHGSLVPIDSGWFDDPVRTAMRDQHGFRIRQ